MRQWLVRGVVGVAFSGVVASSAVAQAPATEIGPKVGEMAPTFTLRAVNKDGALGAPISLDSQKGNTVVIAFFPKARTRGCTIQMEAYRDQYASLFNEGKKVTLIGVSTDPDSALISWAKDAGFPFVFASDADGALGTAYAAYDPTNKYEKRLLYVIGPDGKIAYKATPFRQSTEEAYTELGAAIDKSSGK